MTGTRPTPTGIGQRYQQTEKYRAARKRHYEKNREAHLERVRQWFQDNPEKKRVYDQERRARLINAPAVPFTAVELDARLSMFPGCWVCGGDWDCIDHVKPLAAGGSHMLSNLRPICRPCNSRKHAKWDGVEGLVA